MANDNNIKTFTAIDIEKYHKGLLSSKEMHDMEKAALDDSFLSDALEGYQVAGVNAAADMAELKKRLAEKTTTAKIIPMTTERRKAFPWIRIAAAVVIIAGTALLANQFLFTKKKDADNIAKAEPVKKEEVKAADSSTSSVGTVTTTGADVKTTATAPAIETKPVNNSTGASTDYKTEVATVNKPVTGGGNAERKDVVADEITTPVAAEKIKTEGELRKAKTLDNNKPGQSEWAKDSKPESPLKKEASPDKEITSQQVNVGIQDNDIRQNRSMAANKKADEQNRYGNSFTYRGRITDAHNVGVPFANVTNQQDNVGTYTDASGFFNLTSPDSVLVVQVRSIGFENTTTQLRNNVSNNQVMLKDDKTLSEVVLNKQKPNTEKRSREDNVKMEESEPTDGWDNYDAYLANNLQAPDDFKPKKSNNEGSVEVSFEVDKNGEPTNFKIEKSLCSKCDKEAIRLIKEGPKWKKTANKKGRTNVIIKF